MIVGVAVCPGAPFLLGGVAVAVATRLQRVGRAAADAVARLPTADALLVLTASPTRRPAGSTRLLPPGTTVPRTAVRRSDQPDRQAPVLAGGPGDRPVLADPLVGTMVAADLLAAAGNRTPVTVLEIGADPDAATAIAADLESPAQRLAVLVIADGAACHGDDAPGRRDDRSVAFDAALAGALAAGDPAALGAACADSGLARDLLAVVEPLAVLADLTGRRPPRIAELLYSGAPLGVGYVVASWRWEGG